MASFFIADEVQTGFGRTGKMFAMEHYDVVLDLITMSKSIGAGLPISAVTGRAEIMDSPIIGEIGGTYGGSTLGCIAAIEVIRTIEEEDLFNRANEIGSVFNEKFSGLPLKYKEVGEVRSLGAMCAMEFVKDQITKEPNKKLFRKSWQKRINAD